MAENPAPTQSWCAHYPLALPINQQQSKQNVALQYRARSPSPQIISMGYAAHPCANCRRSVRRCVSPFLSATARMQQQQEETDENFPCDPSAKRPASLDIGSERECSRATAVHEGHISSTGLERR